MSAKDGGQAFPIPLAPGGPAGMLHAGEPGMTLRDYFAGQALVALLAPENMAIIAKTARDSGNTASQELANGAYEFADAMLFERERNT